MFYPTDEEARRLLVDIGRRMYEKNYVAANDGNLSCRISPDEIMTTPTGVSKGYMTEDDMVRMRLDGKVLARGSRGPSSEVKMHLRIYRENPSAMAVCHAHPPVSTAFAIAGLPLDAAIYPQAIVNLGVVPCTHYEAPGSEGIPESVAPYARDYNALLLGNHGVVAWGPSLTDAWYRLESVEHFAVILMNVRALGRANVLSNGQIAQLIRIREALGTTAGGVPVGVEVPTNLQDAPGGTQSGDETHG